MKRRTRDSLIGMVFNELRLAPGSASRQQELIRIGESLMTEWKDLKRKEIETKIVTAGGYNPSAVGKVERVG